ncbi:four-carbon acid sugar kinase family protein [Lysobacter korlensis]|uniref:Four-carbon acid sugar kinase family protein n=1 Tax=Lysobacter korlensis TaxID=553636 RepID=A0ABV6RT76_9GAMM
MPEPGSSGLRLAFYGDDFTGSVDVLLQLTRAGWRSRLFLGLPDPDELAAAAAEVDAVGIAGIARSLPTDRIDAEVRPALTALAELVPPIVQYKACSTADSSPTVGSLGRVIEIAREVFGQRSVPVLFAQPDFGRYTAFGHHFAAEGGTVYRLDRQPTMSNHPVTPMRESELARHLALQTDLPIGSLHHLDYVNAEALAALLAERTDAAVVLDALHDEHVALVGAAVAAGASANRPRFAIGSGGLSKGLGRALGRTGDGGGDSIRPLNPTGPVLAVSGSRSPQTSRQIEDASRNGWSSLPLPLDVPDPVGAVRDRVLAELGAGRSVVVATGDSEASAEGDELVAILAAHLAALIEAALRADATSRVIVCGGDTSSRVVRLLGADSLTIAANPMGNVVVCALASTESWLDGTEILLKGGQVGPVDLFEQIRLLGSDGP